MSLCCLYINISLFPAEKKILQVASFGEGFQFRWCYLMEFVRSRLTKTRASVVGLPPRGGCLMRVVIQLLQRLQPPGTVSSHLPSAMKVVHLLPFIHQPTSWWSCVNPGESEQINLNRCFWISFQFDCLEARNALLPVNGTKSDHTSYPTLKGDAACIVHHPSI